MDSKLIQYLKLWTRQSNIKYNKQRPLCASLLGKAKKKYNIDRKASGISNTKKVQERFRDFYVDKVNGNSR